MTIDPMERRHGGLSNADENAPPASPQALSEASSNSTNNTLSSSELRRRRLAALQQSPSPQVATTTAIGGTSSSSSSRRDPPDLAAAVPAPVSTTSSLLSASVLVDEDQDLQAAIALSLHSTQAASNEQPQPPKQQDKSTSGSTVAPNEAITSTSTTGVDQRMNNVASVFHSVMWDNAVTTQQDKERWLQQGIDVCYHDDGTCAKMMDIDPASCDDIEPQPPHEEHQQKHSILSAIGSNHGPWGLKQMHGGPCGVLAAVQAEVLKLLLFGASVSRKAASHHAPMSPSSRPLLSLEYPTDIHSKTTFDEQDEYSLILTPQIVRQALAMSIGLIVARASLMPPAQDMDNENDVEQRAEHDFLPSDGPSSANIVLPSSWSNDSNNGGSLYTGLTWDHLYPSSMGMSSTSLTAHTISVPSTANPSKRQKTHEPAKSSSSSSPSFAPPEQPPQGDDGMEVLPPRMVRMIKLAHAIANFLLKDANNNDTSSSFTSAPLDYFQKPGGVILLTMSLVCSRGAQTIQDDMDDSVMGKLTSQFGHCSQELMNLLLTGQAVSNVFDNTLTPSGGGLTCRGIQSQPDIGYLSQLEAMRYCQVGGYYKSPRFPIWVVGSSSHFSVLFGEPSCLKESKSDILLEKCRRAFKSIQGAEENGFIPKDALKQVLERLELDEIGNDDALFPVLCAMCDVGDAGIIVWDEFWKIASRLMTGATLESVLQRQDSDAGDGDESSMPPLLLTNGETDEPDKKPAARRLVDSEQPSKKPGAKVTFKEDERWNAMPQSIDTFASAGVSQGRVDPLLESDEEMARRLALEWGAGELNSPPAATAAAAARPSSPMEIDTMMSADEELARKLQAEVWETEGGQPSGSASVDAVAGSPVPPLHGEVIVLDNAGESRPQFQDTKMPAASQKLEFEKYGESFHLYHYNGLRGGNLAPLRVTRLTAEEAVGASVPLTNAGGASGGDKGPGATWDLEDVLRTKWPSCGIDFLGKPRPSID